MKLTKILKEKKKPLAAAALVLAAVVVFAYASPSFAATGLGSAQASASVAYKEEKVVRTDLTVGVTESGTASLQTNAVSYPVSVEVEDIYVKAGQRVKAGDPLLKVNLDSLEDEYSTLQNAYNSALLKLEEAQLKQTTGSIDAKLDYDSTILGGTTADLQYDYSISEIYANLSNAEDKVEKLGDQIEQLADERTDLRKQKADAQDAYNAAKAALAQAQKVLAGLNNADEGYEDARLAVADAQDAADDALTTYERVKKDYDEVDEEYSDKKSELATAKLSLEKLESQLDLNTVTAEADKNKALAQTGSADTIYNATISQLATAVSSARAEVNAAKKELDTVGQYLSDGIITADTDGLVMSIACSVGDTVNKNSTLVNLATSTIYVMVSVSQDDIADLALEQEVKLDFDAYPEETYTAKVDSISYSAARMGSTSVSYTITVLVTENLDKVFEGMTCDATFITRQEKDTLAISNRAVTNQNGVSTVKVKNEDGSIVVTTVETGFSDGRNVQILSGLEEGQTVLIESKVNS
ncbi:MAG: efflux RND transporter periplasmic adaptor subunit [Angelakisella sp.]|nr:efflux RND transporter periplasmic adaptor subunit [Angelakisella sp.]